MIEQWKLARNLLDAKKSLDSFWYISKHISDLYNVRNLCYDKRSKYYINLCAVMDKSICKNGKKKNYIHSDSEQYDSVIARTYQERDQYYAHKDEKYIPAMPFATLEAEVLSLQCDLQHIKNICIEYLPNVLTLDYVCYDGELFRRIEKINPADEERIKQCKYPAYGQPIPKGVETFERKILWDIDDIKSLSEEERKEYCVIMEDGLTFEEGLQLRQDACVKINVLFNKDTWVSPNKESWDECIRLREEGFFDKFGRINPTKIMEQIQKGQK